ncbi:hypothetical protein KPH14_012852, partial [Odynerus spinipes]
MTTVADILENPPATGKYEHLRQALIKRFSNSQEKQLRTLLSSIELGDKKPSHLLREMQSLAGENATEGLLRTLWLQRLPTRVQELLLLLEDTDLGKLAECADKLHEHPITVGVRQAPYVAAVDTPAQGLMHIEIEALTRPVAALTSRLDKQMRRGRSKSCNRSRDRYPRSRSKSQSQRVTGRQCYYHRRFGARALKCEPPCSAQLKTTRETNRAIVDRTTGWTFLVDTGADVSILPVGILQYKPASTTSLLYAVDGNRVRTYYIIFTLNLGLRRPIRGQFIIAGVTNPVIGADILKEHGLIVDLQGKRLIDNMTGLMVNGFCSQTHHVTTMSLDLSTPFHRVLAEYPSLTSQTPAGQVKTHGV